MLVVISPAKKLDFEQESPVSTHTMPEFIDDSKKLISGLRKLSKDDISGLLKISDKLADLNFDRYKSFKVPFTPKNSKQALYAFRGDTYVGLEADTLNKKEVSYAQQHLRILSGLYGSLAPLDLIQPYRLEMGTNFGVNGSKNLYEFWKEKITHSINEAAGSSKFLVNCASKEYFSAVDQTKLNPKLIDVSFKIKKGESYKVIGIHAKKARGACAKFIIQNKVKTIDELKKFNGLGFKFNSKMSSETELVFTKNA
jgi:cytoplasmic iron level regulating protein YaaA (DUF328/UPF0246 family)